MNIEDIINFLGIDSLKRDYDTENSKILRSDVSEYFIAYTGEGYFVKKVAITNVPRIMKYDGKNTKDIILATTYQSKQKSPVYKLFIPNKGIPALTMGRRMYLSPFNIVRWAQFLSEPFIKAIVKYSCPSQEWWLSRCGRNKYDTTNQYAVPLSIVRKCTNLQQYITKINKSGHTASQSMFPALSIGDITWLIIAAEYLHNPVDMWNHCGRSFAYDCTTLVDTIKMAAESNQKFTFSPHSGPLMKQHDKILKEFLLTKEPVPLNVANVFKDFQSKFPMFELIDDGNRLLYEGKAMRNCVASRDYVINRGEGSIYSYSQDNNKYTVQINKSSDGLFIREIKGFANSYCPEKVKDTIQSYLDEYNKTYEIKQEEPVEIFFNDF